MKNGFDISVFKQPKSDLIKKILLAFWGIFLMGLGIAFNSCVGLGTDPISVFSDGIHSFFKIDLGSAFNVTNAVLFFVVLIFGRRYINIGTLIHALFLGFFVNFGVELYSVLNLPNTALFQIMMAVIACVFLFFGTALLIAANVGLDVWTGFAMILKDRTNKEYKIFRVAIDVFSMVTGFLLGGKVGVVTVLAAFFGGPVIQNFVKFIKRLVFTLIKIKG